MAGKLDDIGEAINGGGRYNPRLLVAGGVVAIVVGAVLVHALGGHRAAVSQTATAKLEEDNAARDKARVRELASYAAAPDTAAPVFNPKTLVLSSQTTQQQQKVKQSGPPTPYQQWKQQELLRAHMEVGPVKSFHDHSTMELAQAGPRSTNTTMSSPGTSLHPPASPYTVMAGSMIPAVLVNGINSDLPGPVIAQVSENVFDSATGKSLLIPQGSKLIGNYASAVYGQQRAQVEFNRLIFPDASSMDLPHSPATDQAGYAGASDEVNNHYLSMFGTAAALALISAGQSIGQIGAFGGSMSYGPYGYQPPSQWELATQSAGTGASAQFGNVGQQVMSRGLNRAPTLTIRPGYRLDVLLTTDLVFPHPFGGQD